MCGINTTYKIIFLSNHKVGSTSVEKFLSSQKLVDIRFTKLDLPGNKKHTNYKTLLLYLQKNRPDIYKDIENYEIVVFTRNPLDRMKSLYYYQSDLIKPYYTNYPTCINSSITKCIENDGYKFVKFIQDIDHKNVKIFKIENIDEFKKYIKIKIHIKQVNIGNFNKSHHTSNILDDNTISIIKEYFKYEIENFYSELK